MTIVDEPQAEDEAPDRTTPAPPPPKPKTRSAGSFLESGSTARSIALSVGAVLIILLFTQVMLPGRLGSESRGTPMAILFTGIVLGLVNSLTAAGMILIYRTTRVINFAQTAIGVTGATLVFDVVQLTPIPFAIAFPLGLLVSAGAGLLFEIAVIRRFFYASRLVLTVATIAAASLLASFGPQLIRQLPFIPYNQATASEISGGAPVRGLLPFAGFQFQIGALEIEFGFPEVFAIEVVVVALLLISAFLRFTRAGVAVRALAENAERASLLGISVGKLSMTVWMLAGILAGASAILTGAILVPGQATGFAPAVLLPALAAAVLARFRSLPIAVFAAVAISVVARSAEWSLENDLGLINVGLFAVITIALLFQRRRGGRSEEGAGVSWQAVEEQRPVPKELARIGSVRAARYVLIGLAVIAVLGYPFVVSTGPTVLGGNVALTSIIILSLVVLTGWSGQVSLGQYGFAAIGAVVGGSLTSRVGIPFWFAIFIAAAITGGVAVLVGLPALRIRGLFLAVATFAFGLAISSVLFNPRYFGWLLPTDIERPRLFFVDFEDEKSMYYLCVAALVLCVVVVGNLRRSRLGRVLIALRENENNVQSFGINVVKTKLLAFAISGALAGFAGAILAHQLRGLNAESFAAQRSVDVFLFAVLGGVSSVAGALIGSLYYNLTNFFTITNPIFLTLFRTSGSFFVLLLLFVSPGGVIALINRLRDGVLKIIAQRRQIIVPSLFADYDPEALEKRLIPLSPPSDLEGLAALDRNTRFTYASELYHGSGERIIEKLGPAKETAEAKAIGAASISVQEDVASESLNGAAEDE